MVYLNNGDRVTGEIKSLYRGLLEFKTDHMGTLLIDWEDISEIVSDTGQSVELTNGQRFYGPLEKSENSDTVAIKTEQGIALSTNYITNMYPVEAGFWQQLDLSFQLGFNWDKSSEVILGGTPRIPLDREDPRASETLQSKPSSCWSQSRINLALCG